MCIKRNFFILMSLFFVINGVGYSQNNFGVKAFGVVADFSENKLPDMMTNKLSEDAKYLQEPGLIVSYEHFSNMDDLFSLKIYQGLFVDATQQWSGFTHFGVRRLLFQTWKHSMTVGFGPSLMYQQERSTFPDYVRDDEYKLNNLWEYRIAWVAAEIEYNYYINKNFDFSLSFLPVHKQAFTFSMGIKYWFTRSSSSDCGCAGSGKKYKSRSRRRR